MPWKHALRDLTLVVITLLFWRADATLRHASGLLSVLVAVIAGSLAAFAGYLVHEWGHLLGARVSRSVVRLPASPAEIFLFNFNSDRNSREQFLLMSCGGFLASALVIILFLAVLPFPSLASLVAFALTVAGVIATAVLEIPPFVRVLRGGALPRGGAYASDIPQV
jgi:hypothetical protein